jgi:hypothetical protein
MTTNGFARKSLFSLSTFAAVAGGAGLMLSAGIAGAGIADTKHNLSSSSLTGTNKFGAIGEICVFCHTPHGADTAAPVPLWNRHLTPGGQYLTYDQLGTSTLDATVLSVGSVSLACLSCHDGTQAMNTMLNQPGSGGYFSTGSTMTGVWTGPASGANPVGSLNYGSIVNIGTDLKNDHPVGMQFCGGGITAVAGAITGVCADDSFYSTTSPPPHLSVKTVNNNPVFWVDTETSFTGVPGGKGNQTRNKTDLMLYTRPLTVGGVMNQPFVECATCHDPHSSNVTFLRVPNNTQSGLVQVGSALCLTCHSK